MRLWGWKRAASLPGACNPDHAILPSMPNHPMKDPVTWLYPAIEHYNTGRLQVSPVHELYYEESGNPGGKPVIFLHGGPGGGSDPDRKSTRLNSSHLGISYAVFCLKKKNTHQATHEPARHAPPPPRHTQVIPSA